jgi:alcohol dehydrogenase YqhD (iron-dependent ADH family)
MENFVFSIPTTVFFGKGQIQNLGPSVKNFGGSKVLLAYGGGSIKKNGIYDEVTRELKKAGIVYFELPGIKPNPRIESAEEGIKICRQNNVDFILAVGGGSTVDASKAIAAGVNYEGKVMDLLTAKAQVEKALPLGVVLTMAGTGTELDFISVITAGKDNKKLVIMHPALYPKFAVLDPEYTFTVSKNQTAAGCADILSHLMELYFVASNGTCVQDGMNEGVMKAVVENAPKVVANPKDYNSRASIMWASSMALASFQFCLGKPMAGLFSIHYIGHELSSLLDMTHGITLALVTPAWMRYTIKKAPEHIGLFARFARNVFGVCENNDKTAAEQGMKKLEAFYAKIGIPKSLKEAGVPENKLRYLAKKATENGPLGALATIDEDGVYSILSQAYSQKVSASK